MGPDQFSFERYGAHVVATLRGELDDAVCPALDGHYPAW